MQRGLKYFYISIYVLIACFLIAALALSLQKKIEAYFIQKSIRINYATQAKFFLPEAVQNLKLNQDDWILCTDLGLSLGNISDPKVMAAWVAYYRYGKKYCGKWWKWPDNTPCKVMESQEKYTTNSDKILLLKKITLCYIAQKIEEVN